MARKEKQIPITPTSDFRTWLEEFKAKNGYKSLAEAFVGLASEAIYEAGYTGTIMNSRGKYDREIEAMMKDVDLVTDFGRNDPAESDLWTDE